MPLRVAFQMDPLEGIGIAGDSTFALMLKAQALGHQLYHYLTDALTYADGRLYAGAHQVSVQPVVGNHFSLGDFVVLDLGSDVDVVLMRQDPPFDLGYISATHLLERIQGETLVVNDPAAVRNAPEKLWVLDLRGSCLRPRSPGPLASPGNSSSNMVRRCSSRSMEMPAKQSSKLDATAPTSRR